MKDIEDGAKELREAVLKLEAARIKRYERLTDDGASTTVGQWEHKTEQFYMPAKFLPPIRVGDRYCFPGDEVDEVWEIGGASIQALSCEEVKVIVYWRRPLYGNEMEKWCCKNAAGKENWVGDALAVKIWDTHEPGGLRKEEPRFQIGDRLISTKDFPATFVVVNRIVRTESGRWRYLVEPLNSMNDRSTVVGGWLTEKAATDFEHFEELEA